MQRVVILLLCIFAALALLLPGQSRAQSSSLMVNGDFENWPAGRVYPYGFVGDAGPEKVAGRSGNGVKLGSFVAINQSVSGLDPAHTYRISAWVRGAQDGSCNISTDSDSSGAGGSAAAWSPLTLDVSGYEWVRVFVGGYGAACTFDDLALVDLSAPAATEVPPTSTFRTYCPAIRDAYGNADAASGAPAPTVRHYHRDAAARR